MGEFKGTKGKWIKRNNEILSEKSGIKLIKEATEL